MSKTFTYDSAGKNITCMREYDALLHPCDECDVENCEKMEEMRDEQQIFMERKPVG